MARLTVYPGRSYLSIRLAKDMNQSTWAEPSTFDDWLNFLCLKSNVELEVFDIAVQFLSVLSDFRIGIPFQERCIC